MNNPINKYDPTGRFWGELFNTIIQIRDIVGAIGAVGITVGAIGIATYKTVTTTKTSTKEKADPIAKVPSKCTQYWAADSKAIPSTPLSYSSAQIRIATGKNVIARNKLVAYVLVKPYYRNKEPIPERTNVEGYYWHYHLNSNVNGAPHIWFYGKP